MNVIMQAKFILSLTKQSFLFMWKLSLKTYRQCRHNCWAMGRPLLVYRSKKNVHFSVPSDPWKQSRYVPSYHWEPLTEWHSVTSQKTWILRKTAVRTSNLLFQHVNITWSYPGFLCNKTNWMHKFHTFILSWNSTCFGQFVCPSSGVHTCMTYTIAECTVYELLMMDRQTVRNM